MIKHWPCYKRCDVALQIAGLGSFYVIAYIYIYISVSNINSLSLHVSAIHGHHQVHTYLAETVPLYLKVTYPV
jgi:hypothetical protein